MSLEEIRKKYLGNRQENAERQDAEMRSKWKDPNDVHSGPVEPNYRLAEIILEMKAEDEQKKKAMENRRIATPELKEQHIQEEDTYIPFSQKADPPQTLQEKVEDLVLPDRIARPQMQPSHELIVPGNSGLRTNPYTRGDDINQDYFTFLRANIIAGKPAKPTLEEDATFYFALRAYANGESIMFKGPSRSGKSLLADRISMLSDHVIVGGASNNALLDYTDSINTIGKVYITEHQSVVDPNPRIKEIVKHILEGKDYEFLSGGKTKRLDGSSQILTTAADENRQTQKIDVEVYARYTPFRTTLTPDKIATISQYMNGLEDGTIDDVVFPEEALDRIKTHFEAIRENETVSFINPFIKAYANHLPETQKSLHSRSLYLGLIKASTKFDSVNRVETNDKLVTNLSDLYLVHEYKYDEYCENLQLLTAQTFYSHRNNPNELEKTKHENTKEYELGLIDEVRQKEVDWCSIWKTGFELMKTHHPQKLQEWVDLNSKNGMVMVYDPIARQEIEICPVGDDTYA